MTRLQHRELEVLEATLQNALNLLRDGKVIGAYEQIKCAKGNVVALLNEPTTFEKPKQPPTVEELRQSLVERPFL
jgi:hypothetical protein